MSTVQGWCPTALRPMPAADGFLVRIRPPAGRLTALQANSLAALASEFGHGVLTLTSRANIQLRGIASSDHPAILSRLVASDLAADSNVIVTPFERDGDGAKELAAELAAAALPDLPAKFGFAVDTGPAPVLADVSADIRLERAADGMLLLRADGAPLGLPVSAAEAVQCAVALAHWFCSSGGTGRMRAHLAVHAPPPELAGTARSAAALPQPRPGPHAGGLLAAFAFGEIPADTLAGLARLAPEIRVTPWRMLFVPGVAALPPLPGIILDPASPMPRIYACTGAPGCSHAFAETRPLAKNLAPHLPPGEVLHVSGCAKGCAHSGQADVTLTAGPDGFAVIRNGKATGLAAGISPERIFG